MKNGIWILVSGMFGAFLVAIVMTIWGDVNQRIELQANVATAMEGALQDAVRQENVSQEELMKNFVEHMAIVLDAKSDMVIDVYQADVEKGIFAVCVRRDYLHPNGANGDVEWKRVIICENGKVAQYTSDIFE